MTQKSSKVPARRVNPSVPSLKNEGEQYVMTNNAVRFLESYTQNLDEKKACQDAGIEYSNRDSVIGNPHVQREMALIQRAWRYKGRLTAESAAGEHMRLMEKFEDNFDSAEKHGDKAKYAGTLAKMSEASMKATDLIGKENHDAMPSVVVNIDMGDSSEPKEVNPVIEGN